MKVKFLKNHTHETSKWRRGDIGDILGEFAKKWEEEGILKIVDATPSMKAPEEVLEELFEEEPKKKKKEDPVQEYLRRGK